MTIPSFFLQNPTAFRTRTVQYFQVRDSASTAVQSLQGSSSWPLEPILRTQSLHACAPEDHLPPARHTCFPTRRSLRLHGQEQHKSVPLPVQFESYTPSNLPSPAKRISGRGEVALCASSHRPSHSPPTLTLIPDPLDTADYELVRIYHPDSPIARVYPPEISEARFHAISTSYDVLRGRRPDHDPDSPDASLHPRVDLHALWRAKQRLRQDPLGPADDRWKDGVLLGSIIVVRSFPIRLSRSDREG